MSVARAQREVSSREFAEWIAFDRLEHWSQENEWIRAAIIAREVHNGFQSFSKHPKRVGLADFMPDWSESTVPEMEVAEDEGPQLPDVDELYAKSMRMFQALGGIDTTKRKPN